MTGNSNPLFLLAIQLSKVLNSVLLLCAPALGLARCLCCFPTDAFFPVGVHVANLNWMAALLTVRYGVHHTGVDRADAECMSLIFYLVLAHYPLRCSVVKFHQPLPVIYKILEH